LIITPCGSEYPFVFRPHIGGEPKNSKQRIYNPPAFELIGYYYLQGEMQGEITNSALWNDVLHVAPLDPDPITPYINGHTRGIYGK
jgi:hypothetical protein